MLHKAAALTLCLAACASPRVDPDPVEAPRFPDDWVGTWAGEVEGLGPSGVTMRFDMQRTVAATDDPERFSWTTIYSGEAGESTRNYTLLVRDASTGSYAIDEHNGIVLEARLIGGRLVSWFEVQGTELVIHDELRAGADGELEWSFEVLTTRGESIETGDGIAVTSTIPTGRQSAVLRRVD